MIPRAGSVVGVRIRGVWHEGLVSDVAGDDGRPTIVHKSKRLGRVAEEPWGAFAQSARVVHIGYFGRDPSSVVLARARARLGEPWTPIDNCQRFTRQCHRVPGRSPDVEKAAGAFLAGFSLASIVRLMARFPVP